MNIITKEENLIGKTIKKINILYDEISISFDDGSLCVFDLDFYYDSFDINFQKANTIENSVLLEHDFITEEEYEEKQKKKREDMIKRQEKREQEQYEILKKKFKKG